MQGSPLVRRTNGDERRQIGDERGDFSGFLCVLIGSDERRRTATNSDKQEFGGSWDLVFAGIHIHACARPQNTQISGSWDLFSMQFAVTHPRDAKYSNFRVLGPGFADIPFHACARPQNAQISGSWDPFSLTSATNGDIFRGFFVF